MGIRRAVRFYVRGDLELDNLIFYDGVLTYLHSDHLGSASLATDASGGVISEMRYYPYGKERWAAGASPTDFGFTGQRDVPGTSLMYYRARYYHPALGRFISADSIVPGAASGAGGGAATLGYDPKTRLTPLTVNLGEFVEQINAENREILQFGWFFQWNVRTRREHNVPRGPVNPQALNRYAYVLNNPLRYVNPSGHFENEAILEHLQQAHPKTWASIWAKWLDDAAWMDMLHTAVDGDIASYMDSDGNLGWFKFSGYLNEKLTGAELVAWPTDSESLLGISLQHIQSGILGSRVSGLLRTSSAGITVRETLPYDLGGYYIALLNYWTLDKCK